MFLYRILISCAAPILIGLFLWRIFQRTETCTDLCERLGTWKAPNGGPNGIWLHGASIGEVTSAKSVVEHFISEQPNRPIYITCNTVTARDMVHGWQFKNVYAHLAPLDLRVIVTRLLRNHSISAMIVLESDIWPNKHSVVHQQGIPIAMIGARISEKSAAVWAKRPKLAQNIFGAIALLSPQDAASAKRFVNLGVPKSSVLPVFNLKETVQAAQTTAPHTDNRASIWLAASTHPGEDAILIEAHALARKHWPELRLILAPRHPKRAGAIAALIRDSAQTFDQRSAGTTYSGETDIFLADTLGEMAQWYSLAGISFVAGSLVEKGGHTPFEPIAHGCAILHGPYTANFADSYAALASANAALTCGSPQEICDALLSLKSEDKQRHLAHAAQSALNKGTSPKSLMNALAKLT